MRARCAECGFDEGINIQIVCMIKGLLCGMSVVCRAINAEVAYYVELYMQRVRLM